MADRLVIDTCVFIDGIFNEEENPSSNLLSQLDSLDARLIFSQDTIGELLYILKKQCNDLGMDESDISEILTDIIVLFQKGKSVNTKHRKSTKKKVISRDPDDEMFIDAAFAGKATHLITLDKRSGILNLRRVPFICCTPEDYLESINKIEETI